MIFRRAIAASTLELADEGHAELPPVVLLHGFTGAKETWASLRRRLSARYRVITIDLPGHGGSDPVPGGFAATVDAIAALLDALWVGTAALAGYSLGGRLALALALTRPDQVARLLLESASPGIADDAERETRRHEDDRLANFVETAGIEAFVDRWERLELFATLAALPPEARGALRRQRLAGSASGLAASLRSVGVARQPWLGERLGEIAIPVTLVAGSEDTKFRAVAAAMATRITGARLEIVDGAGHVTHLERSDAFEAVVDRFLAGHAPGATHGFTKEELHVD